MKATSRDFVSRREDDLQPRRWSWRRRPSGASLSWREDDILKFRPYGDDLLTFRFLYCADDIRALRWPATSAGAKTTFAGVSAYPSSRLEDDIRGARCLSKTTLFNRSWHGDRRAFRSILRLSKLTGLLLGWARSSPARLVVSWTGASWVG